MVDICHPTEVVAIVSVSCSPVRKDVVGRNTR